MLTCPNKVCGKVFAKPLITSNLQQNSNASYRACPYCLTEITISENENKEAPEETHSNVELFNEKPGQNKAKTINCSYHFGYIGEREHKEQIPEECLICVELIQCMHKK